MFLSSKPSNCLPFHSEYMPAFFLIPVRPFTQSVHLRSLSLSLTCTSVFYPLHSVPTTWNFSLFLHRHKHTSVLAIDSIWNVFPQISSWHLRSSFSSLLESHFLSKTFLARLIHVSTTHAPITHQYFIFLLLCFSSNVL